MSESNKDQQIESLEEKVTHLSRMLVKSFGYADQDPDTFLQNARRTTEAICRFMYTKELGEPKGKMMLNDYGRELLQKKIIPDKIGILIGTIQTYGNYAAHAQDDLSEATREWIAPCQTALASLTNWFFLEYLKGNIPNELLTPIQSYSEPTAPGQTSRSNTSAPKKSTLMPMLLVGAAVLVIGIAAFYFINKSNNTVTVKADDTPITSSENVVKQQEDLVDNLNSTATAADAKRIAILYFDNGSDNAELSRLRKGLADMLISDLSKIKMLNVIERARLEEILKEQKLNNSKEFDASTASKVGKLLGVQYILTGAFFDIMGSMRMDARIIDVETGKIIKSEGIDGPTNTFFDLEKKLVVKIAGGLNVDLTDANTTNDKQTSLSYETSLLYSDGLNQMDKGEKTKAIELFKKVLQKNPDFVPAQQALNKLMVNV
jgi:TolB-like protein